jgi:TRAP-type C4-dicarboxylate transport system substrate-binding protein
VTVGSNRWSRLPEDVREILTATARELQAFVYETAERMDVEYLEQLRDADVAVNEPDFASFAAASTPIYAEFGASIEGAQAMLDHALGLARERAAP